MGKTLALTLRELRAYLYSPIAYTVMAVFLVFTGLFFGREDFRPGQPAQLSSMFIWANLVLIFVSPILTMRLVSEEKNRGTIETLMTAPVTDTQVILGKFFGVLLFTVIMIAITLADVTVMVILGGPELGPILTGYIGLLLLTMVYLSVGLLASTCTRFQLVSALASLVFLAIMTFFCNYVGAMMPDMGRRALWFIGFQNRFDSFVRGTLPLTDVVYFLSITATALFLSIKVLESRKWRA
jgi:ABC-2 type transport system permease protein